MGRLEGQQDNPAAVPSLRPRRFQVGGALHEDAVYVPRPWDRVLYQSLQAAIPCHVTGPRQSGKTSLAVRVARRLIRDGFLCPFVDLSYIGTGGFEKPEDWYQVLLEALQPVTTAHALNVQEYWNKRPSESFEQYCIRYFKEVLLATCEQPIVCFIDEIDTVFSLKLQSSGFFHAVRAIVNARTRDPVFERLNFCFLGVVSAIQLVKDPGDAPFNIMTEIRLDEFTRSEAHSEFVPVLNNFVPQAVQRMDEILDWTSGHPYMTHRLCDQVARYPEQSVESLVKRLFLQNGRTDDPNLAVAEQRLDFISKELKTDQLPRLYRWLLSGKIIERDPDSRVQSELYLCGLCRFDRDTGRLLVRNRIFAQVFDEAWAHSKEHRSQVHGVLAWYLDAWLLSARTTLTPLPESLLEEAVHWADSQPNDPDIQAFMRANQEAVLTAERARQADRLEAAHAKQEAALANQRHRGRLRFLAILGAMAVVLIAWFSERRVSHMQAVKLDQERQNSQLAYELEKKEKEKAITLADEKRRQAESERKHSQLVEKNQNTTKQLMVVVQERAEEHEKAAGESEKRAQEAEKRIAVERESHELAIGLETERRRNAEEQARRSRWDAYLWELRDAENFVKLDAAQQTVTPAALASAVYIVSQALRLACGFTRSFFPKDSTENLKRDLARAALEVQVATFQQVRQQASNDHPVTAAAFAPDGAKFAVGDSQGHVMLFGTETFERLHKFVAHQASPITSLHFSKDGAQLLSASIDGMANIWDIRRGARVRVLRDSSYSAARYDAAFSPDSTLVVTAGIGPTQVWDLRQSVPNNMEEENLSRDGQESAPQQLSRSVAFSLDSTQIFAAHGDGSVRSFSTVTGLQLYQLKPPRNDGATLSLAIAPSGNWLAAGHTGGTVHLWDLRGSHGRRQTLRHLGQVHTLAISPNGRLLAGGNEQGEVLLLQPAAGVPVLRADVHSGMVTKVAFSPRSPAMLLSVSRDGTIQLHPISLSKYLSAACALLDKKKPPSNEQRARVAESCSNILTADCPIAAQ